MIPFVSPAVGIFWQADLLDMSKYANKNGGNRWILIVIDIFDRRAYARAMKNKTAKETATAFEEIIKESTRVPMHLLTDSGSEFKGELQKLLDKNKISHRMADPGDHNLLGVIDRFSKTLKTVINNTFKKTMILNGLIN